MGPYLGIVETAVTRFWRDGFERYRNGQWEYVTGHWVERDDWDRYSRPYNSEWVSFTNGRSWPRRYLDAQQPNATCPVCEEAVWFFRNKDGGCAYFDEIGKPWTKHPCMDSRLLHDRTAHWQAHVEYRSAYDEEVEDVGVLDARAAHTDWALAFLSAHMLELSVRETEAHIERAITVTKQSAKRPETKRRRRERLSQLRERLRELKSELRDSRAASKSAQQHYEDELHWFEEFGS